MNKLSDFLEAPIEEVRAVAPDTLILAAGGTRRSAALSGIAPESNDYARWSRERMMQCCQLLFDHGVQHILTFAIVESQMAERTAGYREKLEQWVDWGLAGPQALADYERLGWRVRLVGSQEFPALGDAAARLEASTPGGGTPAIWWFVIPDLEAPWRWLIDAARRSNSSSRKEVATALYGEPIPPATLLLSFGKPLVSPALLPPLLYGKTHCYWSQRPSYELDRQQLRAILYDFAFLRRTWREDKRGRAEAALAQRSAWQQGPTIGLGRRLGPFWYPVLDQLPGDEE
ncbi:MAG: hypothetical protein ACOC8X_00560 [Chloroflexota bacterium]